MANHGIVISGPRKTGSDQSKDGKWRPKLAEAGILLLALLMFGAVHFLLPNNRVHQQSAAITDGTVYRFSADSPEYVRMVLTFPKCFTDTPKGRAQIIRPLYVTAGWGCYFILNGCSVDRIMPDSLVEQVSAMTDKAGRDGGWRGLDPAGIVLAWIALLIVNVLISWIALLMAFRGLCALFPRPVALGLALLPAAHLSTVDFLFVPGAGSFNLLIPAAFLWAAAASWPQGRTGLPAAAVTGVAMLGRPIAYPLLNWLYECIRPPRGKQGADRHPDPHKSSLGRALLFLAGPFLFYLFLLYIAGVFRQGHAVERYETLVWMADYAREGRILEIPVRWGAGLIEHLVHVLRTFWAPVAVALVLVFRSKVDGENPVTARLVRHLALYTVAGVVFWCVAGWMQPWQSVTHFPGVVVLLGALAVTRSQCPGRWVALSVFLSFGWHAYELYSFSLL